MISWQSPARPWAPRAVVPLQNLRHADVRMFARHRGVRLGTRCAARCARDAEVSALRSIGRAFIWLEARVRSAQDGLDAEGQADLCPPGTRWHSMALDGTRWHSCQFEKALRAGSCEFDGVRKRASFVFLSCHAHIHACLFLRRHLILGIPPNQKHALCICTERLHSKRSCVNLCTFASPRVSLETDSSSASRNRRAQSACLLTMTIASSRANLR